MADEISELEQPLIPDNWSCSVFDEAGIRVLTTQDMFKGLDKLKKLSPGAKLIRDSDSKLLAYTTAPRPEDNWLYNL